MMSRRLSLVTALTLLVILLPAVAFAQTSRVEGLGIQGDYVKDYTGIYTYTSGVSNVGNLVYGELGVAVPGFPVPLDRGVGAVLGNLWDGRFGTWAIHMRQFTPQLGQGDLTSQPAPGALGADPNFHSNEAFDLMWGRKFGTMSLGLRLNRSYYEREGDNSLLSSLKYDVPSEIPPIGDVGEANLLRNILGVGIGAGFELGPSASLEANVLYQSRTFEITDTLAGGDSEEDGPTTYQLAARMWWQWQPNVMVVPVFKYYSYDLSTQTVGGPTFDNSLTGWQIGAAGNWTIGANDLFVLGLTFAQNNVEQEAGVFDPTDYDGLAAPFSTGAGEITETFMPMIFAALETHVNNWLTLRFGAQKGAWHSLKFEDTALPATDELHDSPFTMSLGAGVKLGTLQIDAVLNPNFPQNNLYLVSGSSTDPLFPKVTATYSF